MFDHAREAASQQVEAEEEDIRRVREEARCLAVSVSFDPFLFVWHPKLICYTDENKLS